MALALEQISDRPQPKCCTDATAQCPSSATIAAEWSSTESRATMLAALRSMQSFSRLFAFIVGLGSLRTIGGPAKSSTDPAETRVVIDRVWRCIMGIALVPAFIALAARLTIPETPRYYLEMKDNLRKAVRKAIIVYPDRKPVEGEKVVEQEPEHYAMRQVTPAQWYSSATGYLATRHHENSKATGLQMLLLVMAIWALADAGFYGMSLDDYTVLASLASQSSAKSIPKPDQACGNDFGWITAREGQGATIYHLLERSFIRSLELVAIAAVAGSVVAIVLVQRFRRRYALVTTFVLAAIIFAATGATLYLSAKEGQRHIAAMVLYAILQFVLNVGPNTLVFVISAEIWPTIFRGSFYGLANAGGKLGGIIVRSIIGKVGNNPTAMSIRLFSLIPVMLLGALLSWFLPVVQYEKPRGKNNGGQTLADDQRKAISGSEETVERGRARDSPQLSGSSGCDQTLCSNCMRMYPSDAQKSITPSPLRSDPATSASASSQISTCDDDLSDVGFRGRIEYGSSQDVQHGFFGVLRNKPLEVIAPSPRLST